MPQNAEHDSFQKETPLQTMLAIHQKAMRMQATTEDEIATAFTAMRNEKGPTMLEIRVSPGARKDLGRPTTTPIENRDAFMNFMDN